MPIWFGTKVYLDLPTSKLYEKSIFEAICESKPRKIWTHQESYNIKMHSVDFHNFSIQVEKIDQL